VVSQAHREGIIGVTNERMNTVQIACLSTSVSAIQ
jgi:hypothetical protein